MRSRRRNTKLLYPNLSLPLDVQHVVLLHHLHGGTTDGVAFASKNQPLHRVSRKKESGNQQQPTRNNNNKMMMMMMTMMKNTVVSAGASCITTVFIMLAILAFTLNCRRNIIIHFNDYHATTTTTERSSKSSVNLVLGCDNRQLLLQDTEHSITFVVPPAFNPRCDLIRLSDDPKLCELGGRTSRIFFLFPLKIPFFYVNPNFLLPSSKLASILLLQHLAKNLSQRLGIYVLFSDGHLVKRKDDGSWDPLLHLTKNQSDSGYLCSFSDRYYLVKRNDNGSWDSLMHLAKNLSERLGTNLCSFF